MPVPQPALDFSPGQQLLVVLPGDSYSGTLLDLCRELDQSFDSICYVTLTKMLQSIVQAFEKGGINYNKSEFIDACTQTVVKKFLPSKRAIYIDAPNALTDILLAISRVLDAKKSPVLLFDSVSVLFIYRDPNTVAKFVHSITTMLRAKGVTGIFTCLATDEASGQLSQLEPFVDQVVRR